MAPAINYDDLMMLRQRCNLLTPVIGIRQPAVGKTTGVPSPVVA